MPNPEMLRIPAKLLGVPLGLPTNGEVSSYVYREPMANGFFIYS